MKNAPASIFIDPWWGPEKLDTRKDRCVWCLLRRVYRLTKILNYAFFYFTPMLPIVLSYSLPQAVRAGEE